MAERMSVHAHDLQGSVHRLHGALRRAHLWGLRHQVPAGGPPTSSTPETTRPGPRPASWETTMPPASRSSSLMASTASSGRPTRASPWWSRRPPLSTGTMAGTCPTASTARRPRTTGRGGAWWVQAPGRGPGGHCGGCGHRRNRRPGVHRPLPGCGKGGHSGPLCQRGPHGAGDPGLLTLDELRQDYGIAVCPIVTVREIMAFLHNRELDGKVWLDDATLVRMEAYLAEYGAR